MALFYAAPGTLGLVTSTVFAHTGADKTWPCDIIDASNATKLIFEAVKNNILVSERLSRS